MHARTLTFALAAGAIAVLSAPAEAHFALQAPASWMSQDSLGNPQKTGPCGNEAGGTATGTVSAFMSGQTITVTINETVFHPGHYRIALSVNDRSELPAEPPVTVGATACGSVPIQNPVTFPVLADGVFMHTVAFNGPQSIQLKLPANVTCTHCTLQVMEFMSSHGAPCFYHHCADLSLSQVAPDGGFTDSGTPPPADGGGTNPGPDGSTSGGPDGSTGFINPNTQNGCACSSSGATPVSGFAGFVALAAWLTRRNRRRNARR
jgi:MYXO-CTERM domain-containing protein